MTDECLHEHTRWLWSEPKEAQDAFEDWLRGELRCIECVWLREICLENAINDDCLREVYYEEHNAIICCDCGEFVNE